MSLERIEKVIAKRNQLESVAKKYPEALMDYFAANCGEDLKFEDKIRQNYAEKIDANRDLQIGIVGRVKAGKSSLLNALLFNGQTILPKAATPMTAALTILSYSDDIEIRINFFDKEDIEALKQNSEAYEKRFAELVKFGIEDACRRAEEKAKGKSGESSTASKFCKAKAKERAERDAKRQLGEDIRLSGAHDQYKKIKESTINESEVCGKVKILKPQTLNEIAPMLADYVGSEGRYMPFTQSVEIAYPNEKLKGVRIVDTPGFNDPVPSREQRAYQLLKASDVVLILSPAGRYLDDTDKEVLTKITTKDGLRELFVVASQVDTQLYGDEYADLNGDVFRVRDEIKKRLAGQTTSVLSSINSAGVFDQLVEDKGSRIIMTSGDCHSMSLTFADRENWDGNKQKIWENLCDSFPNFFSDDDEVSSIEALKNIGNTTLVEEKIELVKVKKKEILASSANQICQSLESAVDELAAALKNAVRGQMERIRSANLDHLHNEKNGIESFCMKVEPGITRAVNEAVADWRSASTKDLMSFVNTLCNDAKNESASTKESFTRHHSYTTGILFWKKHHSYETSHTRVNATLVRSAVEDYIDKVNNSVKIEVMDSLEQLKRKIASKISIIWAEKAAEQSLDSDAVANRIRAIIENMNLPDFKVPSGDLPEIMKQSGSVEDEEGNKLLAAARAYLSKMANTLNLTLTDEISRYASSIQKSDVANTLLEKYRAQLISLIKEIENKESSIKNYQDVLEELENLA